MTSAWMRLHECNAAADAALCAATDALGSDGFPLLIVEYQRAVELAAAVRRTLRPGLESDVDLARRIGHPGSASGG